MKRWRARQHRPAGPIVACHDYQDERGRLLFQVRRHHPKGFSVCFAAGAALEPDGRYRRIPYRLLELLAAAKACERAGTCAICVNGRW